MYVEHALYCRTKIKNDYTLYSREITRHYLFNATINII
jgi:hypothetical protein